MSTDKSNDLTAALRAHLDGEGWSFWGPRDYFDAIHRHQEQPAQEADEPTVVDAPDKGEERPPIAPADRRAAVITTERYHLLKPFVTDVRVVTVRQLRWIWGSFRWGLIPVNSEYVSEQLSDGAALRIARGFVAEGFLQEHIVPALPLLPELCHPLWACGPEMPIRDRTLAALSYQLKKRWQLGPIPQRVFMATKDLLDLGLYSRDSAGHVTIKHLSHELHVTQVYIAYHTMDYWWRQGCEWWLNDERSPEDASEVGPDALHLNPDQDDAIETVVKFAGPDEPERLRQIAEYARKHHATLHLW